MFQWASYSFVRFTLFLVLGIGYYLYASVTNISLWLSLLYGCSFAYLLAFFVSKRYAGFAGSPVIGILAAATLFCFGVVRGFMFTDRHNPAHLLHQSDTVRYYQATVTTKIQERAKSYRTELSLHQVKTSKQWKTATGKLLFYIKKDSLAPPPNLQYGDVLLVKGTPRIIEPPKNPQQFNYKRYLSYQNIHHQHFTNSLSYKKMDNAPPSYIFSLSIKIRDYCNTQLRQLINSPQEYGIATALLLGIKDRLDSEVLEAYSGAGLMHLLAVSGLHVGFIYLLLSILLKHLKRVPGGKIFFALIIIGCLWLYAFITGLSASVLRAVTMFSVITAAQATKRRTNIYNTLAFSAFALLVYDPFMLTSVGFQLSYLAVAGIVYMQPKIYGWLYVSNNILDRAWQLTSVSIAAQIATFPLALYYFHQFPNYFLLSNLLVLPLAPTLLGLGVATLLFSFVPYLNTALGYLMKHLIETINLVIFEIDKLPAATTNGVFLRSAEMWLIYIGIIGLFLTFQFKKLHYLILSAVCAIALVGSRAHYQYQYRQQEGFAILHLNKHAHLHFMKGKQSIFIANTDLKNDKKTLGFNTSGYLWSKGIKESGFLDAGQNQQNSEMGFNYRKKDKYALLQWQGKTFLILQKYMRYRELKALRNIQTDYLIIQNKAVWSLKQLKKHLHPKHIVIDNSNGFYRGKKLNQEAKQARIPCTWISKTGAFML